MNQSQNEDIYHNTVSLTGSSASASSYSYGIYINNAADKTLNIKNNVFNVTRSSATAQRHYAINIANDQSTINEDFNFLYSSDYTGKWKGTDYQTFAAYIGASSATSDKNGSITIRSDFSCPQTLIQSCGTDLSAIVPDDLLTDGCRAAISTPTLGDYEGYGPLPIELLEFRAVLEKEVVVLTWTTATEINNDFFTIERSLDAKEFEAIGTVKGAGNSNQALDYYSIDYNPPKEVIYYRLKQTDFDGKYSYSEIVKVNNGKEKIGMSISQLYFNDETLNLTIENINTTPVYIEITNVLGQRVYYKTIYTNEQTEKLKLEIDNLSKGNMYFIRIGNNFEKIVKKFTY